MTPARTRPEPGQAAALSPTPVPGRRGARRQLAAVAVAALALVLTACSQPEEKRSFAVPSDLCGITVPSAVVGPVLPKSGKTVKTHAPSREVGKTHCKVDVDGTTVFSAISEWRADPSVRDAAHINPYIDLDEHTSEDATYMWSGKGGVRRIPCPVAAKDHPDRNQLFVRVLVYNKEFSDADAAKELLLAYAKSVAESEACTGAGS
ncbi:hypothetical protein HW130_21625 [Streptomyces sp. PKU-EA00015]|uniref:hypothetical protein n=1 Tax=Streptomyces sp. PKU-EA00015 TaxID=2748326 RepID=UPI0015A29FEE|nr:hypothetical protein [Streptomyces sp. PKU-EA00015]NWF28828.1 hypothetical protein [Streptomyces sp. PKU-EA00015]